MMPRRVDRLLRFSFVLVAGMFGLGGCGGGSAGGGTIITPPPATGPASGTEFLYQFDTARTATDSTTDLMVSTVNPSTGAISPPIYAAGKYMYALVEYASSSEPTGYADSLVTYSIDASTERCWWIC